MMNFVCWITDFWFFFLFFRQCCWLFFQKNQKINNRTGSTTFFNKNKKKDGHHHHHQFTLPSILSFCCFVLCFNQQNKNWLKKKCLQFLKIVNFFAEITPPHQKKYDNTNFRKNFSGKFFGFIIFLSPFSSLTSQTHFYFHSFFLQNTCFVCFPSALT